MESLRGTFNKTKFLTPALYRMSSCAKYESMILENRVSRFDEAQALPTSLTPIHTPTKVFSDVHGA